jgi:tetratricopeptide (TPR) repeat protein
MYSVCRLDYNLKILAMKHKIKYLTITGMLLLLISCDDFLDHPVTNSLTDENIGEVLTKRPTAIYPFLASAYRRFAGDNLYARFLPYCLNEVAHEFDLDWTGTLAWNEFATNEMTSSNSYLNTYYINFYTVIKDCNQVIDFVDRIDTTQLSASNITLIKNYKGQALFLRAHSHFVLLQLYGEKGPKFGGAYPANKDAQGIPIMTELPSEKNVFTARSTVEESYNSILSDLTEANALISDNQIPANSVTRTPGSIDGDYILDDGWAQKPAVIAMLGKVYLYMNDYQNAKTKFEAVIADSRFKLDRPVNFTDYIQHRDNCMESIFSLQYYHDAARQSRGLNHPIHQLALINTNVANAWLNTFIDPRTYARFGCGTPNQDPRIYEVCLYDHTWSTWSTQTSGPVWTDVDVNAPTFRSYIRKVIDFYKYNGPHLNSMNVPMIRLADVYLMYAETVLQQGNVAVATEYVNKVRRRAWDETDYNSPGTKGEDLATVDMATIQEERYKELFFEPHRWFDLCRWGILQSELAKYPSTRAGIVKYDDIDYYCPLPEAQLNLNPMLKQSTGY